MFHNNNMLVCLLMKLAAFTNDTQSHVSLAMVGEKLCQIQLKIVTGIYPTKRENNVGTG